MDNFKLISKFRPTGDQPTAIKSLARGIFKHNFKKQTLLGVTGSGKTFTVANVIEKIKKPTLVITHNKTLAAQLYNEFKEFFPNNRVEYFVSYYDYYQPEAYIPKTDTYIAKDASINEKIDKLRLSATRSLLSGKDVIVVASVSCIYGLGSPEDYKDMAIFLENNMNISREIIIRNLVDIQYERHGIERKRVQFRVKGDTIEIHLSYEDIVVRIEMFGDDIEKITYIDPVTSVTIKELEDIMIFPAKHFVMPEEKTQKAIGSIKKELKQQLKILLKENKLVEAQRLEQRTNYDIELLNEIGYCPGIENYSWHFDKRKKGEPPSTLIDFFGDDFLIVVDESHVSLPQLRGMYFGDYARKKSLVEHGFRLPSAYDNRPLKFDEFEKRIKNILYISATPGDFEKEQSINITEQLVRPTGLLDPEIIIRPCKGQVKDLIKEVKKQAKKSLRTLVTTLTKKQSEQLCDFLRENEVRVKYLHSDIDTLERIDIIRDLRVGEFDCLVGVNLLREGLDMPEVSLVAILDADKEGFLRNTTSLIQTIGRASRNAEGRAILYADKITKSIDKTLFETKRRRKIQEEYNTKHNIIPKTIAKAVHERIVIDEQKEIDYSKVPKNELAFVISELEREMNAAAEALEFEKAAKLRDTIKELKAKINYQP